MKRGKGWSKRARNKGYYLEHACVDDLKSKGYFALRVPTILQVGELSKVDVIYTADIHFVQCKVNKKNMSNYDKTKLLETTRKYEYAGATAELCWRNDGSKHSKGCKYEYLQNRTRYRPASIKKLINQMKEK